MSDLQCEVCRRPYGDPNALYQHVRDAHAGPRSGKKAERKRYRAAARKAVDDAREPSMADLMVEAEIAIACGEPVDEFTMAVFGEYL